MAASPSHSLHPVTPAGPVHLDRGAWYPALVMGMVRMGELSAWKVGVFQFRFSSGLRILRIVSWWFDDLRWRYGGFKGV